MQMPCESPLVSVVVPVYNGEKYLDECIRSIQQQTYANLEIVIVDDGSTDTTPEMADGYAAVDPRVQVIHKKNGGECSARNAGMDHAHGQFMAFVDADDILRADAIALMICLMGQDTDIVACQMTSDSLPVEAKQEEHEVWDNETAIRRFVEDHPGTWSACAKLYRSAAVQNVRFREGIRWGGDVDFSFRTMCLSREVVVSEAVVYFYRMNQESVSHRVKTDLDLLKASMACRFERYEQVLKNYPQLASIAPNMQLKTYLAGADIALAMTGKEAYRLAKHYHAEAKKLKHSYIYGGNYDKMRFLLMIYAFWLWALRKKILMFIQDLKLR